MQWSRYAQMRYAGQGFEIHVDLPGGQSAPTMPRGHRGLQRGLSAQAQVLDAEGTVEAVDWTLVATIPSRTWQRAPGPEVAETTTARRRTRKAWFPEAGGYVDTAIIDRQAFASGATIIGPAIVEDPDSTTVLLPGDIARISAEGHLIIDIARGGFAMTAAKTVDPITLTVIWNTLLSIAEELGITLRHTAFSEAVREGDDFATAMFDRNAVMIAQGNFSPGHLGSMPFVAKNVLQYFPVETLKPGELHSGQRLFHRRRAFPRHLPDHAGFPRRPA